MKEQIREYLLQLLLDIAQTPTQMVLLVILLVTTVMVLDAISAFARQQRRRTGIEEREVKSQVQGLQSLPLRDYVSDMQGLAGRPDALISENGYIIPVERKPLAKKIRDRYVAQLLVYMRLVEEFEGKRPPYGYLILGPNCRRVQIENSEQRQAWLQQLIDDMRMILEQGKPAQPDPHPRKCEKCSVRKNCRFRADSHTDKAATAPSAAATGCQPNR